MCFRESLFNCRHEGLLYCNLFLNTFKAINLPPYIAASSFSRSYTYLYPSILFQYSEDKILQHLSCWISEYAMIWAFPSISVLLLQIILSVQTIPIHQSQVMPLLQVSLTKPPSNVRELYQPCKYPVRVGHNCRLPPDPKTASVCRSRACVTALRIADIRRAAAWCKEMT